MSLTVISPLSVPVRVHHRKLLDAMLAEDSLRFVERRADRRGDQTRRRHRVTHRTIEAALELQIAIGDDADEAIIARRRSEDRRS